MLQSVAISAGTGKTHVVAKFAYAWTAHTGRRVIGLTTVHERGPACSLMEGLAETLQHRPVPREAQGQRQTRGNVPVDRGDVLVVDEASPGRHRRTWPQIQVVACPGAGRGSS